MANYFSSNTGYTVEQFQFSDGVTWNEAAIKARVTTNDTPNGNKGNDTYLFGRGSNADIINDYDLTAGNVDVLLTGADVAANQLWFRRVGSDLEVSIIGTSDKSTVSNWYLNSAHRTV